MADSDKGKTGAAGADRAGGGRHHRQRHLQPAAEHGRRRRRRRDPDRLGDHLRRHADPDADIPVAVDHPPRTGRRRLRLRPRRLRRIPGVQCRLGLLDFRLGRQRRLPGGAVQRPRLIRRAGLLRRRNHLAGAARRIDGALADACLRPPRRAQRGDHQRYRNPRQGGADRPVHPLRSPGLPHRDLSPGLLGQPGTGQRHPPGGNHHALHRLGIPRHRERHGLCQPRAARGRCQPRNPARLRGHPAVAGLRLGAVAGRGAAARTGADEEPLDGPGDGRGGGPPGAPR